MHLKIEQFGKIALACTLLALKDTHTEVNIFPRVIDLNNINSEPKPRELNQHNNLVVASSKS